MRKKLLALILALVFVTAIVAGCGNGDNNADSSSSDNASSAPADSGAGSAAPSPTSSAQPSAPSSAGSAEPSATPEDYIAEDTSDSVGFWEDALVSAASGRGRYHIVMVSIGAQTQWTYMVDMTAMLEDTLNIRVTEINANSDGDRLMTIIEEQCSDPDVDGIILDVANYYQARSFEILLEYDKPFVNVIDAMYSETDDPANRVCIAPSLIVDPYESGVMGIQWCYDSYKSYWGDIDTTKLGYIGSTYSASFDMNNRAVGGYDKFGELFPEAASNRFYADAVVGALNTDTFYQEVSATLTANPQIEYWFVFAASGDSGGVGSIRAIEDTGKNDCTLMVSGVPTTATIEWDSGSRNAWVASIDCSYPLQLATALSGVIAMLDGRADLYSLWQEYRTGNHEATLLKIAPSVITNDDYKQSRNEQYTTFGLDKPYPAD